MTEEQNEEVVREGPPWEDRAGEGILVAFARTVEESALKPTAFFSSLRPRGNILDAALYGIGIVMITALVDLIWSAIILPVPFLLLGRLGGTSFPEVASAAAISWIKFFVSPVVAACVTVILAGLVHAGLSLLGSAKHPFETTFRIICYSAAPLLLTLVPFCGNLVGEVWMIVLTVIGIRECHETTTGHALLAVLTPLILLFGCCGMFLFVPVVAKLM